MELHPQRGRPFRAVFRAKEADMAKHQPPQVPKKGGGTQERDRNNNGRWRDKRSDADKQPKK